MIFPNTTNYVDAVTRCFQRLRTVDLFRKKEKMGLTHGISVESINANVCAPSLRSNNVASLHCKQEQDQ